MAWGTQMKTLIVFSRATFLLTLFCASVQTSHACGNLNDFAKLYFQADKLKNHDKKIDCKFYALSRLTCFNNASDSDKRSALTVITDVGGLVSSFGTTADPKRLSKLQCAADMIEKNIGLTKSHSFHSSIGYRLTQTILSEGSSQLDTYCGEKGVSAISKNNAVHACMKTEQ